MGLTLAGCRTKTTPAETRSISDPEAVDADRATRNQLNATLHDGLELKLWASETLVQDPVALHADDSGKIFITTTQRRRNAELDIRAHRPWMIESILLENVEERIDFIRQQFPEDKPGPVSGRRLSDLTLDKESIHILEDTTGNGFANRSTLFFRGFNEPVSDVAGAILAIGDDIYLGVSPDLWLIRDSNGDGYGDSKESLVHGFGVNIGFGGHGMSGLVTGPDGRIYWSIGDVGMSVTGSDGKKWHYPRQGVIVRSEPDGTNFEVFAAGLRNTHEFDFDKYGNLISVDNDGDHPGEFERLVYLINGSDSGWRLNWQFGKYIDPKNNRYNVLMDEEYYKPRFEGQAAHILPPLAQYRTGPAGMAYNPGTALGEEWQDYFFVAEFAGAATRSGINAFRLEPDGAAFLLADNKEVMRGILATGLDFGPDGSLYFADWIEGWELKQEGRIWQIDTVNGKESSIRRETKRYLAEDFSTHTTEMLEERLLHPDLRIRKKAQFELASRDDRETLLRALQQSGHQLARIHGLWGLAQIARRQADAAQPIIEFLNDRDDEIRAQAAKMLGDVRYTPAADALLPLLRDASPRVRLFAVEALGRMSWNPATNHIINMLEENNDEEVYLRHAGAIALERIGDEDSVAGLSDHPSKAVRVAAVVALMRMESPQAARFLTDENEFVVTSAARAINDDNMLEDAVPVLAALLDDPPFINEPLIRRVLNANLYEGNEQSAERLARFALHSDMPENLRTEALQILEIWPEPSVLDRVTGDPRGAVQNNPEIARAALQAVAVDLLHASGDDIVIATLRAIGSLGVHSAIPDILELLSAADSPEVRIASLNTLTGLEFEAIEGAVFDALGDDDSQVRMNALRSISGLDLPPETISNLVAPLFENGTINEQRAAINTLAETEHPSAINTLADQMDRLISRELNPELQLDLLLAAERSSSSALHQKLDEYLSAKIPEDSVSAYQETLYGGSANEGRSIFFGDVSAQCINCHMVDGRGAEIGPDLSDAGSRLSREQMLRAMVNPTEHPVSGYTIITVTTQNSLEKRGVYQYETDTALALRIDGNVVELEKETIGQWQNSPSAMPAMGQVLSREQIRDIIEYLASLQHGSEE